MRKIVFNIVILLTISPLVISCQSDNEKGGVEPEVPETPNTVVEEIKEDKLCGTWSLDREDSGILVTTTLMLNSDNTCEYIQEMPLNVGDREIKLSGKWSLDSKGKVIYIIIADQEGNNEITLSAILDSEKATSFVIDDAYSEQDNYSFKKK